MFVQEDSSCCLRVCLAAFGGLNLRALQLHMYEGNTEAVTVERPCKMGAGCCCPLEMTIKSRGQQIGMVRIGSAHRRVPKVLLGTAQGCVALYGHRPLRVDRPLPHMP